MTLDTDSRFHWHKHAVFKRAEQNVWRGRQRWQHITRTLPKRSAAQGSSGASPRGSGKAGDGDSSAADHRLEERGAGQRQRIRGGGACVYEREREQNGKHLIEQTITGAVQSFE